MAMRSAPSSTPNQYPSRHFSRDHKGRLEVSLCAVNRGFAVVWPALQLASRVAALTDREYTITEDELPGAEWEGAEQWQLELWDELQSVRRKLAGLLGESAASTASYARTL